ncbi:MAG: glycoside hydrolase family 3 C-terminal domain-containing protein [Anaerolineaceae bacterium]|jgi:beta-glucosidase|nr:glycoside hydrolase family 3 C-terminal domain-containing protein [Anaerolineaceae bacterium]
MFHYLSREQEIQVESWLSQLTLPEKISLLSGADNWSVAAVPRLGIPSVIVSDGPHGVRADRASSRRPAGPTNAYPTGIGIAATWNRDLTRALGAALAEESREMGVDVLLGPCVSIMHSPLGGRNFETYSEDPYLAGEIGLNWVLGLQHKGVGVSVKHFAGNDQERERMRVNVIISERALREIYLAPFEKIVRRAQPWTVMAAYARLNGTYASENPWLLRKILKEEWGFEGAVISDWFATHSTAAALNAGLDLEMPGPALWRGGHLKEALDTWQVSEETLDDAVRRVLILIARCLPGQVPPRPAAVDTAERRALARDIARQSITLLKNEGDLLPLSLTTKKIAVIGLNATTRVTGGGSSFVKGLYWVTPLEGLRQALGPEVELVYEPGADNRVLPQVIEPESFSQADGSVGLQACLFNHPNFEGEPLRKTDLALDSWWGGMGPAEGKINPRCFSGTWEGLYKAAVSGETPLFLANNGHAKLYLDDELVVENHSGDVIPDYGNFSSVLVGGSAALEAGKQYRLRVEYTFETVGGFPFLQLAHLPPYVAEDGRARAIQAAANSDVAIFFAGNPDGYETEGADRPSMRLPGSQDQLIEDIVAANPRTIVVIHAGAPIEMPWAEKVPAIVWAYYPGQEGGNALADLLTGAVSPSGKLPMSIPYRLEDDPTFINYPGDESIYYGEGIFVGYRNYDLRKMDVRFAFGHGLSYTRFEYEGLHCPESFHIGEKVEISFTLRNCGERDGAEIAQVYVRDVQSSVQRPVRELKGFSRVSLNAGEQANVTIQLDERAFSFYDQDRHCWTMEPGYFEIEVGGSSRDIRLKGSIRLEA